MMYVVYNKYHIHHLLNESKKWKISYIWDRMEYLFKKYGQLRDNTYLNDVFHTYLARISFFPPIGLPLYLFIIKVIIPLFSFWVVLFEHPFIRQLLRQPKFYKENEVLTQKPKQWDRKLSQKS